MKDNSLGTNFSNSCDFHIYNYGFLGLSVGYNKRFYEKNKARSSKMLISVTLEIDFSCLLVLIKNENLIIFFSKELIPNNTTDLFLNLKSAVLRYAC